MSDAELDPEDAAEYRAFLDRRGLTPAHFKAAASPADPSEGALGPSRRTVTVVHTLSAVSHLYNFRTWVQDFQADIASGLYRSKQ